MGSKPFVMASHDEKADSSVQIVPWMRKMPVYVG